MQNTRFTGKAQSGFTIVELIVVIVILGILAAVAIPKFADSTVDARTSVESATLGALKSAWSAAYAVKKAAPTLADVAGQMGDPKCGKAGAPTTAAVATDSTISCVGVTKTDGTGFAVFGGSATPADPSAITIVTP